MTNMMQYVYSETVACRGHVAPPWRKWGPFCLITVACFASMADVSRDMLLSSEGVSLVSSTGAAMSFDLTLCTYTVAAVPLEDSAHLQEEGLRHDDAPSACPSEQLAAVEESLLGADAQGIMRSPQGKIVGHTLAWIGAGFTMAAFAWLTGAATRLSRARCQGLYLACGARAAEGAGSFPERATRLAAAALPCLACGGSGCSLCLGPVAGRTLRRFRQGLQEALLGDDALGAPATAAPSAADVLAATSAAPTAFGCGARGESERCCDSCSPPSGVAY